MTPADQATVFVIDDDARMPTALERLSKSVGLCAESFATPQDFLRRKPPDNPSCLAGGGHSGLHRGPNREALKVFCLAQANVLEKHVRQLAKYP